MPHLSLTPRRFLTMLLAPGKKENKKKTQKQTSFILLAEAG